MENSYVPCFGNTNCKSQIRCTVPPLDGKSKLPDKSGATEAPSSLTHTILNSCGPDSPRFPTIRATTDPLNVTGLFEGTWSSEIPPRRRLKVPSGCGFAASARRRKAFTGSQSPERQPYIKVYSSHLFIGNIIVREESGTPNAQCRCPPEEVRRGIPCPPAARMVSSCAVTSTGCANHDPPDLVPAPGAFGLA